jgi:quinol monooxygenase YgiN
MAQEPLATEGNVLHIYDFRVKPGRGDEFIDLFNKFDYSGHNPMHASAAQVKDGVLCRDADDPDRFYLIGEWRSIEEHKAIRKQLAEQFTSERGFVSLIEGGKFVPNYAKVVSATPAEYLRGGR